MVQQEDDEGSSSFELVVAANHPLQMAEIQMLQAMADAADQQIPPLPPHVQRGPIGAV